MIIMNAQKSKNGKNVLSSWVTPAIVAAVVTIGSQWIMRSCDKQEASERETSQDIKKRFDDLEGQVRDISKDLASLEGQVKILSQLTAVPKGTSASLFIPSNQTGSLDKVLASWTNIEVLERKVVDPKNVPMSYKAAFSLFPQENWMEVVIRKKGEEPK